MNNLLEFRIWDKITQQMYLSPEEIEHMGSWFDSHLPGAIAKSDNKVVTQYSTIKDKNGKKIYAGDIIRVHTGTSKPYHIVHEGKNLIAYEPIYENRVVIFYKGSFSLHNDFDTSEHEFNSKYRGTSYYGTLASASYDKEIMGNIFQNPELLEQIKEHASNQYRIIK